MSTIKHPEEVAALSERLRGKKLAKFARDHRIPGGAAMIYQHMVGKRPISLTTGLAYARALDCALNDLSPRLALEAEEMRRALTGVDLGVRQLSHRDQAYLQLLDGLTESQREEEFRRLSDAKQHNDALISELIKQRA